MNAVFYISARRGGCSRRVMVITRLNAVHALLYLIVSLLAVAVVFFMLGAPFVAALEVIVYAGAIMVLFVFVIMMLNLGPRGRARRNAHGCSRGIWIGPALLAAVLLGELVYVLAAAGGQVARRRPVVDAEEVGIALFGPYLLGVELASMLLLAGLVGAYHLGRRRHADERESGGTHERRFRSNMV